MDKSSDINMRKRFSGSATAGDTVRTLAWPSADEEIRLLSEQIDKDLHDLEGLPCDLFVPHPIPSDEMLDEILKRTASKRKNGRALHLWRAAAIFIPLVLLISFGLYVNRHADIFGTSETRVIEAKRVRSCISSFKMAAGSRSIQLPGCNSLHALV